MAVIGRALVREAPDGVIPIETPPLDDPWLARLVEIVPVPIVSHALAVAAGLEPGRFERVGKVTRLE